MTNARTSYIKVLPLVFLASLLVAALQFYQDAHGKTGTLPGQLHPLTLLIFTIKSGVLWTAIGWAFNKWKEAALAFGMVILLYVANFLLEHAVFIRGSVILSSLQHLFLNYTFLPALVFGFACFKTRSLVYFVPLAIFAYAFLLLFMGSAYLDLSPFNNWYRYFRFNDHFKIYTGVHTYHNLNILSYTYNMAVLCCTFIITGECFHAAANQKKLTALFHIDFSTNYTKPGVLGLFYALRLIINLLVMGLYIHPFASFMETGRIFYRNMSVFSFIATMAVSLLCLAVTVLYYRKFLVEYFISVRKKISWLFWLVNIPIVGLLVFPFVVLLSRATGTREDRTTYYFNDVMYTQKPVNILMAMLAISLVGLLFSQTMGNGSKYYWVLWLVELCLLIWYATALSGYYVILGIGAAGLVFFGISVYAAILKPKAPAAFTFDYYLAAPLYNFSMSLWLASAFNIVQYVILLPVFHLNKIRVT